MCQWLTPVILATQEADIRRIVVQSQTLTNSSPDLILKKPTTTKRLAQAVRAQKTEFKPQCHQKKKKCNRGQHGK
jgi:hypothetical protein